MGLTSETPESSAARGVDDARGLVAPTRRGRSARLIGEVVVDLGLARQEAVDQAVSVARAEGITTGQALIDSGAIRQDQLARALAERLGIDYVDLSVFETDVGALNLIQPELARRYEAVPVAFLADGSVLVAMADPTNVLTFDELRLILGRPIRAAAAARQDVAALIGRLSRLDDNVVEVEEVEPELELALHDAVDPEAPIVKLVHSLIAQAVEQGASDIHCDPEAGDMQVQFRIDGILRPAATIARAMSFRVISRIKIMANLDISERRVPQDGRLAVTIDERRIDVRVVTLPLVKGEGVVMRILDTGAVVRDLNLLGMRDVERDRLMTAMNRSSGSVLVTGPTGSGKTTTLYSALAFVNDRSRSILTIEDPVESTIPGVKQMQVSTKTGVTFANGLRSMLRADPNVIMVGEIRDLETAVIAIQAALSGHLVLSTLHTRSASSAITRLMDMGIEPFMIAAAIDCVVGQRLARTLCEQCKRPAQLPESVLAEHGLQGGHVFEPGGCIRCGWTGYHGRIGLYEVMPITEQIESLVLQRRGASEIALAAEREGMRSMRDDGLAKVRQGITTLAEVSRVIAPL